MGGVRLELKEWKISGTSFHHEDKHTAEFLHPSWHGFLYLHQLIWLQLLLHTHWMWLVQVSMLAHKVWAFFAFILHSAMTSRYMHQMKVVSRWQLQHLQRVCLLWRESWLQFWCKWWNQPTQMDSWTMTVILASIRTCKLQVQKQRRLQRKYPFSYMTWKVHLISQQHWKPGLMEIICNWLMNNYPCCVPSWTQLCRCQAYADLSSDTLGHLISLPNLNSWYFNFRCTLH